MQLWLLNDSPQEQDGGMMETVLCLGEEEIPLGMWSFEALQPNENRCGPTVHVKLPNGHDGRFELLLRVIGQRDWNSSYTLLWKRSAQN